MENKNTTIMYCPLNDGHIVRLIQDFSEEKFEEIFRMMNENFPYGKIRLKGSNSFQELICTLPATLVKNSEIFCFDTVVADKRHEYLLRDFWKKHAMELDLPTVPYSTDKDLYFVAAALMHLKTFWKKEYKAEKRDYIISADKSFSHEDLRIRGFGLENVRLSVGHDFKEESALIWLGEDVSVENDKLNIRLTDLHALRDYETIVDEKTLYEAIQKTEFYYHHRGGLLAPCVEEKLVIGNHLKDMCWVSKDGFYRVDIVDSQALTKLKLNEKGVETRAETVARSRVLFTASRHDVEKSFCLKIEHGLVVDIRYENKTIFVGYIPQEKFQTL